jgi:hypothetical protein
MPVPFDKWAAELADALNARLKAEKFLKQNEPEEEYVNPSPLVREKWMVANISTGISYCRRVLTGDETALINAFVWAHTIQGTNYWDRRYQGLSAMSVNDCGYVDMLRKAYEKYRADGGV